MSELKTYKINYFTPKEREELISKGFVLDEDAKISESVGKDQSLRDIYENIKSEYLGKNCVSENCKNYNKYINKKPPYVFYADIGKYEKGDDGFLYFVLPSNTKMYKGTKYFYSSFPKTHFWVGCQKLAMDYGEWYGGGLNIYQNKKPIRLFVLNKENLEKVYAESNDNHAKELLQMIYGVNIDIEEQTKWICKKNPQWCGKVWLYDEHISLRPDPKPNRYMPVWGSNLIHDYFYEKYHFDGTFLEYFMSPFREIMDEEISLNIGIDQNGEDLSQNIEMIKNDPDYWENWNLDLPNEKDFLLNETYPPNMGFKVNDWYKSVEVTKELFDNYDNLNQNKLADNNQQNIKILSYNVHNLVSANILIDKERVFNNLMKLLELSNAHIIFLQEFPEEYVGKIKEIKKYQHIITTNGADDLRLVALVDLKKCKFAKFDILKDRKRSQRNSILLHFGFDNKMIKIIGTHLEIGKKFMKNTRFVEYADFYDIYKKNIRLRIEQLDKILAHSPDIIIGDFNFTSSDPEMKIIESKGYSFNPNNYTSIHQKKVDYAFAKKNIKGNEKIINYYESDHKPILFEINEINEINGINNEKNGGFKINGGRTDEKLLSKDWLLFSNLSWSWIIILFIILFLFIFWYIAYDERYNEKNKRIISYDGGYDNR